MFSGKIVNNAGGAIALLFRRLITSNKLEKVLLTMVKIYVDNNYKTAYERSAQMSNYKSTFKLGYMSFKKFVSTFKELFVIREMIFTLEVNYKDKTYTSVVNVDLKKKIDGKDNVDDTVYLLAKGLIKGEMLKDLKSNVEAYVDRTSKSSIDNSKEKYTEINKLKSEKMTWKTLVSSLETIYNIDVIKLTCHIAYNKKSAMEENVVIRLKEKNAKPDSSGK